MNDIEKKTLTEILAKYKNKILSIEVQQAAELRVLLEQLEADLWTEIRSMEAKECADKK